MAREIEDLVQLDAVLLKQQLREALDGEQRLAQLVNLLGGEPAELGETSRGGDEIAQPRDGFGRIGAAVGHQR